MLDGRDLLDAEPHGGVRRRARGDPVRSVGGLPHRLARDDDEASVERGMVDGDRLEAVAQLEIDGGGVLVDGHPVRAASQLDPGAAQDERAVGVILELVLGVDAPPDRDVACRAAGQVARLGHADRRGRCQESPDPVARAEAAQHERPRPERDETQDDEQEGTHGRDDTRRAWKGP